MQLRAWPPWCVRHPPGSRACPRHVLRMSDAHAIDPPAMRDLLAHWHRPGYRPVADAARGAPAHAGRALHRPRGRARDRCRAHAFAATATAPAPAPRLPAVAPPHRTSSAAAQALRRVPRPWPPTRRASRPPPTCEAGLHAHRGEPLHPARSNPSARRSDPRRIERPRNAHTSSTARPAESARGAWRPSVREVRARAVRRPRPGVAAKAPSPHQYGRGDGTFLGIRPKGRCPALRQATLTWPPSCAARCGGCRRCGSSRPPRACRCGRACRTAPWCRRSSPPSPRSSGAAPPCRSRPR